MNYDKIKIISLKKEDFQPLLNTMMKITTSKEYTIKGTEKKGIEFIGYIAKVALATNEPYLPCFIKFVDSSITNKVIKNIDERITTSINIFDINKIELLQ